jgi:hypothetical protein
MSSIGVEKLSASLDGESAPLVVDVRRREALRLRHPAWRRFLSDSHGTLRTIMRC